MATNYSPKIITDGLVLALDAANTKSYPGSGTTWSDLSGNGNNGTLTNGPTFNSSNLGSLMFDGADTGIQITNFPQIFNGSVGMSAWCYFNDDSRGIIFGNFEVTNSINFEKHTSRRLRLYWQSSTLNDVFTPNNTIPLNEWHHIHIQRNKDTGTFQFFVNGILVHNPSVTSLDIASTGSTFRIGRDSRTGTTVVNGNISQVQIYNRALSAAEVLQNYNATKGRYGL
jgi:hypothetical protein